MLKLLKPAKPEDAFIQRYDLLMRWALSLTGNNRAQAEDLVHDAFIQFTVRRSELGAIENTDAYLHRILRNMHLSQVRRATLTEDSRVSIANFDSAEIGLRSIDPREHVDLQDELRQICQYACARKETSKAGAVLILRFFHGYYPSEIAQVMRTNRTAVDWWVQQSRREAKAYLNDPGSLRFTGEKPSADAKQFSYARTTAELLAELRRTIFESRKGACLSPDQLKEIYRAKTQITVGSNVLSHIVSCPQCLDAVNRLLGLPLLAERHSDDRLGRDVPPDSSGGAGDGGGQGGGSRTSIVESKNRYKRRLKETIEHRPQELRIAVNGFVLGAQQVSSELSKQVLTVNVDEPIGFIEVFSEQGLRLLFFDVDQPIDGSIEQSARAEFDCGRALDLSLSFRGPWPTINVSYHDPTFDAVESYQEDFDSEEVLGAAIDVADSAKVKTSIKSHRKRASRGLRSLARAFDWRMLLRPGPVTALISLALLIAVALFYRHGPTAPLSASDLLQRSAAAEDLLAANRDHVLHRTLRLEERSSTGQLLSSRRVEVWHSAEKGITARRLYDDSGALVAGDVLRSDGVQTIYHHGKKPELQLAPDKRTSALVNFESAWQLEPAASEFTSLIGGAPAAQAASSDSAYTITYAGDPAAKLSGVISASLVLTRSDLHAVEQTVLVRQGDETREYKFIETSFERRSPSSVAPALFEPEPALLSSSVLGTRNLKPETAASATAPSPFLATADLELQVLKQLNQADAFYGEQISLTRTNDGRLHVEGIVETDKRKNEIVQSLAPLKQNPALQIQVETVAEAAQRQARERRGTGNSVTTGNLEVEAKSAMPAEAELRAYLSREKSLSGEALDQEVRRFAEREIGRARHARRHAVALKQIAERFSADDLRSLDENARKQWRTMIGQHARAAQQELESLRRELEPAFSSISNSDRVENIDISGDADLARAAKRLFELTSSVDEAVGRSFSIYAAGGVAPVKTYEFSRSLGSATNTARQLAQAGSA